MDRMETLHSIHGTPPDLYIPPKGLPIFDRCDEAMIICKEICQTRISYRISL